MSKLDQLYKKVEQLNKELEQTRNEISWEQSNLRAQVTFDKEGDTYIMSYKDRTFKVKTAGPFNRYRIWEGRKILVRESMDNLNKIRLNIALGRI